MKNRVNKDITAARVRVIDADGANLGVMPTSRALELSQEKNLDLVEVSSGGEHPVCRILAYRKWLYTQQQNNKAAKKAPDSLKEMKYRPAIDRHDFDTKTRKVIDFLEKGHKVKVTVMMRGREQSHPEQAQHVIDALVEALGDKARIDGGVKNLGRDWTLMLVPQKH